MRHLPALFAVLILAGCELADQPPFQGQPPLPPAADDTCGANERAALIGQDVTALERIMILGPVRVNRPGTAVTMDYRPNRINFDIDGAERISRIFCG